MTALSAGTKAAKATLQKVVKAAADGAASKATPKEIPKVLKPGKSRGKYHTIFYAKRVRPKAPPLKRPPPNAAHVYNLPSRCIAHKTAWPESVPKTKRQIGIMAHVKRERMDRLIATDDRAWMFAKKNPGKVNPGDIVLIESWNSMAAKEPGFELLAPLQRGDSTNTATVSRFAGAVLDIHRKGVATNFLVRNTIADVGTESRFMLYSPLIKSIRVLVRSPKVRRHAYFLRENPQAFNIPKMLAAVKNSPPFWSCLPASKKGQDGQ